MYFPGGFTPLLSKPNQLIVPLIAIGALAFGISCQSAEDEIVVASASTPALRHSAPLQKPTPVAAPAKENWGQVSAAMVNVRSGPGTDHPALTTLKHGDVVKIEATQSGWLTIQWPESAPLWVAKEGIHVTPGNAGTERAATVKLAAPVRSSATHKASTICTLDPGTKLVVLDESNGWLKIKAPDSVHAYISAKFVTLDAHKPETATAAATFSAKPVVAEKPVAPAAVFSAPASPVTTAAEKPATKPVAKSPHTSAKKPVANLVEIEPATAPASVVLDVPPQASFETPPEAPPAPAPVPAPAPAPKAIVRAEIPKPETTPSLVVEPPRKVEPVLTPAPVAITPAPVAAPAPIAAPRVRPAPIATTVSSASALQSNRYGALQLNDRSFRSVVENNGIALVDFNAHWCGPCRRMSPVIESLASDINSEAAIAKVDVDESPETSERFGVHSIPCLILFKDGREIARHYGVHSKDELKDWIRSTR
jgi:thioredoxin 1